MPDRKRRQPDRRPSGELLREVVEAVVPEDEREKYLPFARELYATLRRTMPCAANPKPETRMTIEARSPNDRLTRSLTHSISYSLPGNDFSQGTKLVVMKWFQRGLSGHSLWQIGERLLGRVFPAQGASESRN